MHTHLETHQNGQSLTKRHFINICFNFAQDSFTVEGMNKQMKDCNLPAKIVSRAMLCLFLKSCNNTKFSK